MALIGSSAATSRLSDSFARALTPTRPAGPSVGALVGLEHEFRVRLDGRQIDFRQVIHRLPIDGLRIDPADPDAYRCPWGGTITADGREAEIAIAPVTAGPAMAGRVVGTGARARTELEAVLPPGATLEGYSTHLSVSVPDRALERTADRFIRHFSVAMTLLLDGAASPGLLVRPRLGRLEIGGEFADGDRLAAASVFALGATRAAARRSPVAGHRLPPKLSVAPQPAVERYGWFVGDAELAAPLHRDGASTPVRLADGRSMSAGAHLVRAWSAARRELGDLGAATLAMVDAAIGAIVDGRPVRSLPVVVGNDSLEPASSHDAFPDAWALATRRRSRPGFAVDPVVLSWDFAVFRLTGGRREAYACLPRHVLGDALAALDAGRLDHLLRAYLFADAGDGRTLASSAQTNAAGLYRGIGKAADLAGVERDPLGGDGKRRRRDDQDQRPDESATRSQPARSATKTSAKVGAGAGAAAGLTILGLPAAAAAAIGGVAIVAVVGGVLVLGGGGGGQPAGLATASASSAAIVASSPPSASSGPSSAAPSTGELVNLDFDACTLLDVATIEALHGSSRYSTDFPSFGPNQTRCFWSGRDAGYVELELFRQKSLSGYSFGEGCSVTPIDGVGEEAAFVECSDPVVQTSMLAFERGVIVSVSVEAPASPLAPEDLGPVIQSVFDQLE